MKAPVPEPSDVLLFSVVGLAEVLQHTPRSVTSEPPSLVILPPPEAEEEVISVTAVVVRVGTKGSGAGVLIVSCSPYDVPTELVA
jgi:hypothetical protein